MSSVEHPGVTVLKANQHHPRRARWRDPVTGRRVVRALPRDPVQATQWLLRKSAELMLRRARTEPPPGQSMPLELAAAKYLQERHRLRESTLTQYRYSLQKFVAWMGNKPVTQAQLRAWRAALDRPGVAAASVNRDLAGVSAFLNHARKSGDIFLLSDQIKDGLERLPKDHEKQRPLSLAEVAQLVGALDGAVAGLSSVPGQGELLARYRAFVLTTLLTGMRVSECLNLQPDRFEPEARRIVLRRADTKTKKGRVIDLDVSPSVIGLLAGALPWGLTKNQVRALRERLHPAQTFKRMRVTCGTYLTCAPGIYGGSSAYMSAARLGHSVAIAEEFYVGVVQVDPSAKTLEAALGLP